MTPSYAVAHPSQPNYLALFAGGTFGINSDPCPLALGPAPNLGSELIAAGYTFGGFAEDPPAVGSMVCSAGKYARKHAPWVNFTNVPATASMPSTSFSAGPQLPTASFVVPNLDNDMHDGSAAQADTNLTSWSSPVGAQCPVELSNDAHHCSDQRRISGNSGSMDRTAKVSQICRI